METKKTPKLHKGNPSNGGKLPVALITPSMIIIFGVLIFPIVYSFILSFNNLVIKDNSLEWVGLKNYIDMFKDQTWRDSVKQTLIFTIISVFCEIVFGVAIALVLNKEFKGRGFVRGIMILPWALPGVVNAIMWKWIFNANYGAFNALMLQIGIIDKYQAWLATPRSAFICVLVANIWKETPYVVLLTIAALANIDKGLYEAASIDGANGWKAFWTITLPLIKPVLLILLITKTIWALQTYDLVYLMTAGGPMGSTEFITFLIQKTSFKYLKWGYGSAMAFTLSIICFIMTIIYIRVFMGNDGTKKSFGFGKKKGGNQ
ncbi:MAG: sugar ABC transporter permease [Lachnospiraceae bacterium]|nr:sugar ABC transporter permease [Lachnospiraceae bacterium]